MGALREPAVAQSSTTEEAAPAEATPAEAAPPVTLYVHVPFCVSVCPYCDFVVVAGAAARGPRSAIARYLEAVTAELALRADAVDARFGPPGSSSRPPIRSLYLGGGTPSLPTADAIAGLIEATRNRFGFADDAEVTIEANPGPDERGDAVALRAAGVTRLSIGAQSLLDAELSRLGRRHRAVDVTTTVGSARAAGIASISLDLLYDVPESTVEDFERSLETALSLEPDHLSLYALTLDDPSAEGLTGPTGDHLLTSPGARRWRERARRMQDDDRAAQMYELATERLAAAGFRAYEISNWARPGHESRHNLAYWRREPHEAVGPGAHAFDGHQRRWNAAPLAPYLAALAPLDGRRPELPPGGAESIGPDAAASEATILALRLDSGVAASAARRGPQAGQLAWGLEVGLLQPAGEDRIALTTRGRLLSNELFARLL
jgi:putative oxygen-independent coproporphyrinogen III oxidase